MILFQLGIEAVERGWAPDAAARMAIRRLCRLRLSPSAADRGTEHEVTEAAFRQSLRSGPIAPVPEMANRQHYELPPEFFASLLGPRRKYSCCYFPHSNTTLAQAEEAALEITCERAQLADGQQVLELGCGWGSLSLRMAERFPRSRIMALSNSAPQRQFIEAEARARGIRNLHVITADMNDFSTAPRSFDRIVSVEMFEHMRNYRLLLERIAAWLRPGGKLFVHHFCHRRLAYPFETEGAANWMGRHFFTGGVMPSADLLTRFDEHLTVARQFTWNGLHYQRTAAAWRANLEARRGELLQIVARVYGPADANRWLNRWRMFLLAVEEVFGFAGGNEWFVTHVLLQHAADARPLGTEQSGEPCRH